MSSTAPGAAPAGVAPTASAAPRTDKAFTPPSDYRRVVVDGREEFCRKYWPTGSRAESHTECLTEAELKQRQDSDRQSLEDAKRSWSQSTGSGAPLGTGH